MSGSFEHPLFAEVYDVIPSHLNRPDVVFYKKLATESTGRVLELGSGTGRVLIPIARARKTICGLEASEHMLGRCLEVLDSSSLNVRDNVELVHGKLESFDIGSRFELIICPFNTLLHLLSVEEQLSCLARVHQHLVLQRRITKKGP